MISEQRFRLLLIVIYDFGISLRQQMEVLMSSKSSANKSLAARLMVLSLFAMVFMGSIMQNRQTISAEERKTSPITLLAYQTSDQLLVDASLANPGKKKLQGTMHLELVRTPKEKSASDQILASFEKDITQTEITAQHRFEFRGLPLPPEVINVRCRFGDEKTEMPLAQILA